MDINEVKKIWGEEWLYDIEIIDKTMRKINLAKRAKILDIGTGQGIMSINLAIHGYDVLTEEPEEGSETHKHYKNEME